jgi:hypothetical protein
VKAAADPDGIRKLAERVKTALGDALSPDGATPDELGFGHAILAQAAAKFQGGSADTIGGLTSTTESTGERLAETADLYDEADKAGKDAVARTDRDDETGGGSSKGKKAGGGSGSKSSAQTTGAPGQDTTTAGTPGGRG